MNDETQHHLAAASQLMMRVHRQDPDAPADVIRAWPRVTLAAHHLSQSLNATETSEGRAIEQIAISAYSMARANASGPWPGEGRRDQEVLKVAMALEAAAKAVDSGASGDVAAENLGQALAVLWIGSDYASSVARNVVEDSKFDRQLSIEQRTDIAISADETARRIGASAQVAEGFISGRPTDEPDSATGPLNRAIATWDIESHRAMVFVQSTMVLHCVARMEAMTNAAFAQFVENAASAGYLDQLTAERLAPALASLPKSWDAVGDATAEVAWGRQPMPPGFVSTAENLRTELVRAVDQTTLEEQAHMVTAIKVHAAGSMAVASTARDLLTSHELRGPARAVARAVAESHPKDKRSIVDPVAIYRGQAVELPPEIRDMLKPHLDACVFDSNELVHRTSGLDANKITSPAANDRAERPESERHPHQSTQISAPAI